MKPEHWQTLESVVKTSLNVEELTIAVLEEINIFSYGMEIEKVKHTADNVLLHNEPKNYLLSLDSVSDDY